MQTCFPLPEFSEEELRKVVETDWQRSYQDTPFTAEDLLAGMRDWQASGLPIGLYGKTIFVGRLREDGIYEFHAVNGGTIGALIRGGRLLLQDLLGKVERAATYYTNPRVGDLAKHMPFPYEQLEVNEGPHRRYMTIFDLRN